MIKKNLDLSEMQPLEGDEEKVREGKAIKILTPNKLLTRLPISTKRVYNNFIK